MSKAVLRHEDNLPHLSCDDRRQGPTMILVKTRIAVVIACHNRRETTLRCLRGLRAEGSPNLTFDLFLLDDASSDGTANAVLAEFPETHILPGTGQLLWGGGMRVAMQAALGSPFDFMLWLNDDVVLRPQAILVLLKAYGDACKASENDLNVVVGCMQDPHTGMISYSGFLNSSRWHPTRLYKVVPSRSEPMTCDTMNGNLVLVPRLVVDRIGVIDAAFPYRLGDIDYGYRVLRAGGQVVVAPGFAGYCRLERRVDPPSGLLARIRYLGSSREISFRPWLIFLWRYAGWLSVPLLIGIYCKALLSRSSR